MTFFEEFDTEIKGLVVVLFISIFGVIGSIMAIRSLFDESESPPQVQEQVNPINTLVE